MDGEYGPHYFMSFEGAKEMIKGIASIYPTLDFGDLKSIKSTPPYYKKKPKSPDTPNQNRHNANRPIP